MFVIAARTSLKKQLGKYIMLVIAAHTSIKAAEEIYNLGVLY
jgi:hypothetical protein